MKKTSNERGAAMAPVDELTAIKRLMVLFLVKVGASQAEIGRALGLSQGAVSRMYRFGKVKPALSN